MTPTIDTHGGFTRLATTIGGVIAALFLAVYAAVAMPASAHADPSVISYSADNATWGGMEKIPAFQGELIPGGELTTTFWAKNTTSTGGTLQAYLGNWTTSANMQAYVRAEINNSAGQQINLVQGVAEAGTELKSVHLNPGDTAKVMLVVGMPSTAGNETQGGSVDPDFSLDFEVDAAKLPTTTTVTGLNAVNNGSTIALTATVAPNGATGQVQFKDGTVNLGTPVALVNGVATINRSFNTNGAHPITAVYLSDATHETSTSEVHTVTVSSVTPEPGTGSSGSSGSADFGSLSNLFGSGS